MMEETVIAEAGEELLARTRNVVGSIRLYRIAEDGWGRLLGTEPFWTRKERRQKMESILKKYHPEIVGHEWYITVRVDAYSIKQIANTDFYE